MPLIADAPNYATLSLMLTPAIFMTANGSLIISTSNRMSRIVDRIRVLNDLGDTLCRGTSGLDFPELRLAHVADQIHWLGFRSDRIRHALTMLYLAFGSFVGTSLALAIDAWMKNRLLSLPTLLAVAGVSLLLGASINLVREATAALRTNNLEIHFYQSLHQIRHASSSCGPEISAAESPPSSQQPTPESSHLPPSEISPAGG